MDRNGSFEGEGLCDGGGGVVILLLLACPMMGEVGETFKAGTEPGEDKYADRVLTWLSLRDDTVAASCNWSRAHNWRAVLCEMPKKLVRAICEKSMHGMSA